MNWTSFKYIVVFNGLIVIAHDIGDLKGKIFKIEAGDSKGFYDYNRTTSSVLKLEAKSRELKNSTDPEINNIFNEIKVKREKEFYRIQEHHEQFMAWINSKQK